MTDHKQKLEFGGVPGNLAMIIGLPIFTAYLFFAVRFNDGAVLPGPQADWRGFGKGSISLKNLPKPPIMLGFCSPSLVMPLDVF